jgi:regulatory protein
VAVITAIANLRRKPRAEVHIDGVPGPTLRLDVIVMSKLAVGQELPPARRRELEDESQRLDAIETALRLLAMHQRSEKDLRDRLRRRGLRLAAVDAAVTRMQELGYLNDAAFARSYVEARQASTPRSRRALSFELTRHGVERDLATEAVEELSDADAAYSAAQRRLRALRNLDRDAFKRRLGNFLASRGFSYGTARLTIDRCWQELAEEDETGSDEPESWDV